MLTNVRSRKLELDYSADVVKNSIKKVVEVGAMYKMLNAEDSLGIYRFMGMSGISISFIVSATVHRVDDQRTSVEFEVSSSSRGVDGQLCLQMLDDYLKVFAQALEGKEVTNQTVSNSKSGGCMVAAAILILSAVCLGFASCNPDEPEPETGSGPVSMPTNDEYLMFTDAGTTFNFTRSTGLIQILYSYAIDQGYEWYWNGISFTRQGYDLGDHLFFSVCLPIDSSHVENLEIESKYFTNDSCIQWTYEPVFPGSILFDQSTDNGTDEEFRDTDTTQYYNRINSIEYLGNHRYDQIQQLVLCDYLVQGTFRMRVMNDITDVPRILDNGSYSMVVSILAE